MKINLRLNRNLPLAGIVAFSLCSVWSLYHLFTANAEHDTLIFWGAAALVELITAWLVFMSVDMLRKLTRSNLSKQDKRFYTIVLAAFLVLTIPTLGTSVWANTVEFGNLLLGLLFPVASVSCAIGAALPEVTTRHERTRQEDRQAMVRARKKSKAEKEATAREAQAIDKRRKELDKHLSTLGAAAATYWQLVDNPTQAQSSIAKVLSISRQAVGQHITRLESEGLIRRNGHGIEVL